MTTIQEAPSSDRALVAQFLAARDEASFRTLYRRHAAYLFRLALRLEGGDRAAAEDVAQEVWLRAVAALGRYRGDAALRTWLGGFVVNCSRERRRRRDADERLPPALPGRQVEAEPALDLETAILELPEPLRDVVVLHALQGYTHPEISELLGIPVGTSKSRLFDARAALRRRLGLADPTEVES